MQKTCKFCLGSTLLALFDRQDPADIPSTSKARERERERDRERKRERATRLERLKVARGVSRWTQ
jgi:hypothetical protein